MALQSQQVSTIGSLQGINFPSIWNQDHTEFGPYSEVVVYSRLITRTGIMPIPVAGGSGANTKYIRVNKPQQLRIVAWIVQRWNDPPKLPHWDTGSPAGTEVLIHSEIIVSSPVAQQFATAWQRASGYYVYSINSPAEPTVDGVAAAGNLATVLPSLQWNIAPSQFVRGVINPMPQNPIGVQQPALPSGNGNSGLVILPKNPGVP
jgi:hypothetical protein